MYVGWRNLGAWYSSLMRGGSLLCIWYVFLWYRRYCSIYCLHFGVQWGLSIRYYSTQGIGITFSYCIFLFFFWGRLGWLEDCIFSSIRRCRGCRSQRQSSLSLSCWWYPLSCFSWVIFFFGGGESWGCLGRCLGCPICSLGYFQGKYWSLPFLWSSCIHSWSLVWELSSFLERVIFPVFRGRGGS